MSKTRQRGRPKKPAKTVLSKRLEASCTAAMLRQVEREAASKGISSAEVIRRAVAAYF